MATVGAGGAPVVVYGHRDLTVLTEEWDALADRIDATPFVRPGWFLSWWEAFGVGDPLVLAARSDGGLAGVLALERRRRFLRSPTNTNSPGFELVADSQEVADALARHVFALQPWSVDLDMVDRRGVTLAAFRAAALARRWRTVDAERPASPFVEIRGSWEDYRKGLSAKRLSGQRRLRRRLSERGTVELCVEDGRDGLDELLTEGFAVEPSGWKAAGGTAIVSTQEVRRFWRSVALWAAQRGWLRLAFLRLGGRAIAFQYALEVGQVHYFLKGGYDPAFRRYAPGLILTESLLERAFAGGLRRFEFLGAPEPWKLEWAERSHELVRFTSFAPSPVGTAAWATKTYGRGAAARARAAAARLVPG